jgi:ribosomal protein L37AE/L43A
MSSIVDTLNKHINKFIKIQLPDDMVVDEGKEKVIIKILEYLNLVPDMTLTTFLSSIITLDKNIEWVWKTTRGTLTKRIAAALYKEYQIKLEPSILSEIGTMLKNYHIDKQNLLCDFVPLKPKMEWWNRGMFEDSNSCFWSERNGARMLMANNGFWCFRVWSDKARQALHDNPKLTPTDLILTEDKDYGMARAWIFPYKNNIVMFNGYARNNSALQNNSLLQLTRIASLYLGTSYKEIAFLNEGQADGLLYINNGGKGYILGEQSIINRVNEVDANFKEDEYQTHICQFCGETRDTEQMTDGQWACENCENEYYSYCIGREGTWHNDLCVWSDFYNAYIYEEDTIEILWNDNIYHKEDCKYSEQYHSWFHKDKYEDMVNFYTKLKEETHAT